MNNQIETDKMTRKREIGLEVVKSMAASLDVVRNWPDKSMVGLIAMQIANGFVEAEYEIMFGYQPKQTNQKDLKNESKKHFASQ